MAVIRWLKTLKQNREGQAMVEMALVLPVLILIMFGIIEFGRVFNSYLVVTNAAREAARVGVVGATDTEIINTVKNAAGTLKVSKLNWNITPSATNRVRGASLKIKVTYPVDIYAPVIGSLIGDPYMVTAQSVMRVE